MADHQAAEKQDDPKPADDVSVGQKQDASTDDISALKSEMITHRQEVARLKEENEKLMAKSEKPEPTPPQAPQGDQLTDRLDKIERSTQLRDLMHNEGMTPKQADAVLGLMKEIPSLDTGEAKLLAAQRDKELFSDTAASSGYDPSIHGMSRPTAGAAPVEQRTEDSASDPARLAYIAKIKGNKKEFQRYLNNMTGSIAAKQVGKSGHKLHPIPDSQ